MNAGRRFHCGESLKNTSWMARLEPLNVNSRAGGRATPKHGATDGLTAHGHHAVPLPSIVPPPRTVMLSAPPSGPHAKMLDWYVAASVGPNHGTPCTIGQSVDGSLVNMITPLTVSVTDDDRLKGPVRKV